MLTALNGWFRRFFTRELLAYLVLAGFLFAVFFWRLGSLTPGISPTESAAKVGSSSLKQIYENPVYLPFKLMQHFLIMLNQHSIFWLRLSGAVFGLIFTLTFFRLAISWFGRVIGLFGTLVFVSLPLFVISARQASPDILLFSPIFIMWLYYKLTKNDDNLKPSVWVSLLLASALSLYIPGMVWWVLVGAYINRRRIITAIGNIPSWLSAAGLTAGLIVLLPLLVSSISRPGIIKSLFLVPEHWYSLLRTAENIGWMILALFIKTPSANPLILGRLPLVNVLMLALVIFGAYALYTAARPKALALGGAVLLAVAAAGLNNNILLLALGLPAVAVFVSAGLRYLYIEWRSIFPRNPVPKTFALVLIAAVVASQLFFGLRYSLVAWPHSTVTKTLYVLK